MYLSLTTALVTKQGESPLAVAVHRGNLKVINYLVKECNANVNGESSRSIDNHDSGYLGMAVQLYVQAHLGHYHILTQKEYSQKLMAQLKSMPLFTYICII